VKELTRKALLALLFCSLLPQIIPIGCVACSLDCPPGTECVPERAYGSLDARGNVVTVHPGDQCLDTKTDWSSDGIPLDAGLELADAGDALSSDGGVP
jgi:hypothetical protein